MKEPAPKIAIVEDDQLLLYGLKEKLAAEGYEVVPLADGEQALEVLGRQVPDLLILDLMLPRIEGLEVCRHLRARYPELPILILSAKGQEADKIEGLRTGADDYLTKPFSLGELLARIEALLRRHRGHKTRRVGDIEIDLSAHRVFRDGAELVLTATEFRLLRFLLLSAGQVRSRAEILTGVWGYDAGPDVRTVDYHVKNLRRKLGDDPDDPTLIRTVYGEGYRLEPP
jgi:DNA-binding response OmpR family regulator